MSTSLIKIEFSLPADQYDAGVAFLSQAIQHGWEESQSVDGTTHFRTYLEDHPAGRAVVEDIRREFPNANCTAEESEALDPAHAGMNRVTAHQATESTPGPRPRGDEPVRSVATTLT